MIKKRKMVKRVVIEEGEEDGRLFVVLLCPECEKTGKIYNNDNLRQFRNIRIPHDLCREEKNKLQRSESCKKYRNKGKRGSYPKAVIVEEGIDPKSGQYKDLFCPECEEVGRVYKKNNPTGYARTSIPHSKCAGIRRRRQLRDGGIRFRQRTEAGIKPDSIKRRDPYHCEITGIKKRDAVCLSCNKVFKSYGNHNRICGTCKGLAQGKSEVRAILPDKRVASDEKLVHNFMLFG